MASYRYSQFTFLLIFSTILFPFFNLLIYILGGADYNAITNIEIRDGSVKTINSTLKTIAKNKTKEHQHLILSISNSHCANLFHDSKNIAAVNLVFSGLDFNSYHKRIDNLDAINLFDAVVVCVDPFYKSAGHIDNKFPVSILSNINLPIFVAVHLLSEVTQIRHLLDLSIFRSRLDYIHKKILGYKEVSFTKRSTYNRWVNGTIRSFKNMLLRYDINDINPYDEYVRIIKKYNSCHFLVSSPLHKQYLIKAIDNNEDLFVDNIVDLELRKFIVDDYKYYKDADHLNPLGMRKYSLLYEKAILNRIQNTCQ